MKIEVNIRDGVVTMRFDDQTELLDHIQNLTVMATHNAGHGQGEVPHLNLITLPENHPGNEGQGLRRVIAVDGRMVEIEEGESEADALQRVGDARGGRRDRADA